MTATSAISPGLSASPGSGGSQRNPQGSRAPATGPSAPAVTWAAVASSVSAIAGAPAACLAPDTLATARIAMLAGVREVRHGWRC
jgi:hypothetical protein